ncbi:hypothetical protein C0995_011884 [Termitomyces sp. Mi166|nr:hypothetical protein C0995_011884 [Termitomyces sp. Mi166\
MYKYQESTWEFYLATSKLAIQSTTSMFGTEKQEPSKLWAYLDRDVLWLHLLIESFTFSSEKEVVIALGADDDEKAVQLLLILDFKKESSVKHAVMDVEYGIAFRLPLLAHFADVLGMEPRSDPAASFSPLSSNKLLFHVAPGNRVVITSLYVDHGSTSLYRYIRPPVHFSYLSESFYP